MPELGKMDQAMTAQLQAEVKEIQDLAMKKLEQKYSELKSKLNEQKAGIPEPSEMSNIKDKVEASVRAKLGLDEE